MSTVIKLKYSQATAQPEDDLLQIAEPAYSFASGGRLFIGADDSGTIVPHVIGGKFFTDMLDHTPGTLTASSAVLVDADSKINEFKIGNQHFTANALDVTGSLAVSASGGLTVSSSTVFGANVDVTGNLGVTGNASVSGNLNVAGDQVVIGNETVSGNLDVTGTISSGSLSNGVLLTSGGELLNDSDFTYSTGGVGIDVSIDGSLAVDSVTIDGSDISTTATNADLTLTPNGTGLVVVNKATGLKVASGTEITRPAASLIGNAVIRYNETSNRFEGTVNGSWTGLGGVVDVDQDTYITAEEGADDDTLRFYAAGDEMLVINNSSITVDANTGVTADGGITVDDINIDGDTININGSTIQATGNSSSGTLILDPAPAAGDNGGQLIVRGDLQVTGTTTTVNSTVIEIADPVIVLGEDSEVDSLDRGVSVKYNDGTSAKAGFFGWDRGAESSFKFIPDVSTGDLGDARFANIYLDGTISQVGGVAPSNGQLLIGTGSGLALGTISGGDSLTVTNDSGSIEIDVDPAETIGTSDPAGGVYTPSGDNTAARGAASFDSTQFEVNSGHVYIVEIDGGTF